VSATILEQTENICQLGFVAELVRVPSDLVKTQPLAFLRLASALINPKAFPVPPDLQTLLDDARTALPSVVDEPEYIRLSGLAKLGNA
jgi:hypothetical protein